MTKTKSKVHSQTNEGSKLGWYMIYAGVFLMNVIYVIIFLHFTNTYG